MTEGSQQVAWFTVYELVAPLLATIPTWPAAGTPAWQQLEDDDPRKWAAILDAGIHWALRIDSEQSARAQASQDISTASDCRSIARRIQQGRGTAYIPRKAS